jgi:ribosome-associated translation inhibitor RaiA
MQVHIATQKVALTPASRSRMVGQITEMLQRFAARIEEIRVELRDRNGRRGGGDKRVRIRVQLAGAGALLIEEERASTRDAVRHALARAAAEVQRALARPQA